MCGQHADDMDNVHLCRQCAETKLWIIGYTRSVRDEKQMMCTCCRILDMFCMKLCTSYAVVNKIGTLSIITNI